MQHPREFTSDVAFTPTVKAIQSRKGSRSGYAQMERHGSWDADIPPELAAFIAEQRSVFLGTATVDGQPYIQHRGGPAGFLRVIDNRTIAFADFSGNRQYITQGNLSDNPKATLFLIDYRNRRRVKIWGEAKIVEGDAELLAKLMPADYKARPEQVLLFTVTAWDRNCPQHIPIRLDVEEVATIVEERDARIRELEAEISRLTAELQRSASNS